MYNSAYLDWCPRATYSVKPRVYGDPGSDEQLLEIMSFAVKRSLPRSMFKRIFKISIAHRTDGFFLFAIAWNENPENNRDELNVAAIISQFVKTKLGHIHHYDNDHDSRVRLSDWKPLHKYPVKINTNEMPDELDHMILEKLIDKDGSIARITAEHFPVDDAVSENDQTILAVLRIREKYSRLFDRTFWWIQLGCEPNSNY